MDVKRRQEIERKIAKATIKALLDAGFLLGVNDGEQTTIHHSRDAAAIFKAMFTTDEDYLYVYEDDDSDDYTNVLYDPRPTYWVRFIYGNDGWDVINDYLLALEPYIGEGTEVQKLIDKYSE